MFNLLQSFCKGSIIWYICILLSIVHWHKSAAQTLKQLHCGLIEIMMNQLSYVKYVKALLLFHIQIKFYY